MAANKLYLVEVAPGSFRTFSSWPECQSFVHGKPFAFAGGKSREEAMAKLLAGKRKLAAARGGKSAAKRGGAAKASTPRPPDYPVEGLTSDAGTHGNPGPCEYQVTDLEGRVLEHKKLGVHTNNYAELAGIDAMIRLALRHGETRLWTDSAIALGWIRTGRLGPSVHEPEAILSLIRGIQAHLRRHPELKLLKWKTRQWGEIPSDFGRK